MNKYNLIILIFLSACNNTIQNNSTEFQQVDYKIDSLRKFVSSKYKKETDLLNASYFLLANMPFHYTLNGNKTIAYLDIINAFEKNEPFLLKAIDSVKQLGLINNKVIYDALLMEKIFFTNNLESSYNIFNKWHWNKTIPKDVFLNYVLPYNTGNEPFYCYNWRDYFRNLFLKDRDNSFFSLKKEEAAAEIQLWLYQRKKSFKIFPSGLLNLPNLSAITLDKILFGTCNELTIIGASAMRALGIPASIDFTPSYLNVNAGHTWNCIITGPTSFIPFDITTNMLYKHKQPTDILTKVYRKTYQYNVESHFNKRGNCTFVPEYLNTPFIKDVTSLYIETRNITVPLIMPKEQKLHFSYLSVFRLGKWVPVAWGEISGQSCTFNAIGKGGVYLPQYLEFEGITSAQAPILIEKQGKVIYLKPDTTELQTIKLLRKFPLNERKEAFLQKLIGGIFQGSNDSLFNNATTLFEIQHNPGEHFNDIEINNEQTFRYVRYLAPPNGYGNIAEIKFYQNKTDNDTMKLTGRVIGSVGSIDTFTTKMAAFDNNILTFFCSNNDNPTWAGLDLGKNVKNSKIKYLARNDMNSIQAGYDYKLYYWNDKWISLGQLRADKPFLVYRNVPNNALLWLRCLTTGQEERIFTYKDDKQLWW
jgi:hypothetical protein